MQYALKYDKSRICEKTLLSQIFNIEVLAQFLLQLKKITKSISFGQIARQLALLFFDFQFSLHPNAQLLNILSFQGFRLFLLQFVTKARQMNQPRPKTTETSKQ